MNRLKDLRIQQSKTLNEVGNFLGVTKTALNRYEKGVREPKLQAWEKLANYFDVDPEYLVGWSDVRKR
ncbi:helix-turn-helix domain-containing protein [Leuconostoc mesenteroides]|uniref:helix-turn-helix domain-containing protein n=1 Tax=Leuconostoc mesenteroides TaxID=1245 RepID=UPI00211406F9|nr:helix-turn-helix transcriptional regulator [Leuconostoc mesenteroides]UUE18555.1 helix-turn-helix domain-containing protein [Leuconostoc mesenteroides]